MNTSRGLGLARFLYNQNPFYLISALLVLFGVQKYLGQQTGWESSSWWLAGLLIGYTSLLALCGFLIVRFGRVWDDARSIFMVLLLLLAAISVSFDHLCVTSFFDAALMLGLAFVFAIVLTESLLRGLKILLPVSYRLPYYGILLLWFGYPLLVSARSNFGLDVDVRLILLAFPFISGLMLLTLIPAIRNGRGPIASNGTPWKWPLYPWSIFALMIVGLCGRSWLLCMSFDTSSGASNIWAVYFLAPIFVAVMVLLFEIGIREQKNNLTWGSLVWAMAALPLSCQFTTNGAQQSFQETLAESGCSPMLFVWLMLCAFFIMVWMRGVDMRAGFLSALLLLGGFLPLNANWSGMELNLYPLLLFALLQIQISLRFSSGWQFLAGGFGLSLVTVVLFDRIGMMAAGIATGGHVMLVSILLAGMLFESRFASQVRVFASALIILIAMVTGLAAVLQFVDPWLALAEISGLGLLSFFVWKLAHDRLFAFAMGGSALCGIIPFTFFAVERLGDSESIGLIRFFASGIGCLIIGVFISCLKAGLSELLKREIFRTTREVNARFKLQKPLKT